VASPGVPTADQSITPADEGQKKRRRRRRRRGGGQKAAEGAGPEVAATSPKATRWAVIGAVVAGAAAVVAWLALH